MSDDTYTLCAVETGAFTDRQNTGGAAMLAINPPPQGYCWVPGAHNPFTRRLAGWTVDDFGEQLPVIEVQTPAPPAETDWTCWDWDAAAEVWREVPKLKLLQANAPLPLIAQLAQLDDLARRPIGEITEAQVLGAAPPAAAVARLLAINADKQVLRTHMAAMAAAASIAELQALQAAPPTLQTLETP